MNGSFHSPPVDGTSTSGYDLGIEVSSPPGPFSGIAVGMSLCLGRRGVQEIVVFMESRLDRGCD